MALACRCPITVSCQTSTMRRGVTRMYDSRTAEGMRAPATTVFPLPPASRNPLARFSLLIPLKTLKRGASAAARRATPQARSVAFTIMFMPCASAVWYRKFTMTDRPDARGSTRIRRPCRVVASACARSASKCPGRLNANRSASSTESNENIGETTFSSRMIRAVTPPARVSITMPRSYERTSAPSVVAIGT